MIVLIILIYLRSWLKTIISSNKTIKDVINVLENSGQGIALVVGDKELFEGTVTDGDVRRGLINGMSMTSMVSEIMNRQPITSKKSDSRDEMSPEGYLSNNSGGISGGISTGQDINLSIALKPTSSINKEGKTIDTSGESQEIQVKGRHDPCVGVRATPIAEAMTALVVMDHFLRNRAQNADVITDIPDYS